MTWALVPALYSSPMKDPHTQLLKLSLAQSTALPRGGGQPPGPHSGSLVTVRWAWARPGAAHCYPEAAGLPAGQDLGTSLASSPDGTAAG